MMIPGVCSHFRQESMDEEFGLCSLLKEETLIGVQCHSESDGTVLVSCQSKGAGNVGHSVVTIYKISDQKPTRTWSLKKGHQISSPAVVNQKTGEFLTVTNKQAVRIWSEEHNSIEDGKKTMIDSNIHRVFITKEEPVLVLENGSAAYLSKVKDTTTDTTLDNSEHICCCEVACVKKEMCVAMVTQDVKKGTVYGHFKHLDQSLPDVKTCIKHEDETSKLISSCVLCQNNQMNGLTLWSDGSLYSTDFFLSKSVLLHKLPHVDSTTTITAVDSHHIAIAGMKKNNKESGLQDGIGVWDTKFGTLKSWQRLPSAVNGKKQLFYANSHIFIPCDRTLYCIPYHLSSSSLIEVLGKQGDTLGDKTWDVPQSSVWDAVTGDSKISQSKNEAVIMELLCQLKDPQKTPNHQVFKNTFKKLCNLLNSSDFQRLAVSTAMQDVLHRCADDRKFWPSEQLGHLIKEGAVTASACDYLMPTIIEHQDLHLLNTCHQNIKDLSEKVLVQCLQFYLRLEDTEFMKVIDELKIVQGESESSDSDPEVESSPERPLSIGKEYFINQILTSSYNDVFLLENLKSLKFDTALSMLQYLHYLLSTLAASITTHKSSSGKPSLLKVVDWLSLLLDAHCTQLILSPDARTILVELHQIVDAQGEYQEFAIGARIR